MTVVLKLRQRAKEDRDASRPTMSRGALSSVVAGLSEAPPLFGEE